MSIVVYKEYRPLRDGKRRAVRVPYTLYTIDEADKLGIPYERDWRHKFHELIDLNGKNIVTDDDPPYVVPVVECQYWGDNPKKGRGWTRPIRKLILPWTHVASYRRPIHVGVPATAHKPKLSQKRRRLKPHQFRLFIVMLALMEDPLKVVEQLFGFKAEIEQIRFLRTMMEDPRTADAAESVARDVFSKAGIDPVEILKELYAILQHKDTPIGMKIRGRQDLLDRAGVRDKEKVQQPPPSLLLAGLMPSPSVMPDKLKSMMDVEIQQLSAQAQSRLEKDNGEE